MQIRIKLIIIGCVLCCQVFFPTLCWGQTAHQTTEQQKEKRTVRGRVTDRLSHEPMAGVTVIVEGTSQGVVTDKNGQYVISIDREQATLLFSFIGYEQRRVKVKRGAQADVALVESQESINEVVVTGYANIQKSSFTGNTTKIAREELLQANPNNLISALQTFDPSFRIAVDLVNGADPNKLPSFTLRGQTGIGETTLSESGQSAISREVLNGNSNLPIFILDGFEVDVEKIYDLDINTVHSINILKDAAATAIYGSRAANGVIVIERRAPQAGRFRIQYSGSLTMERPDLSSYNLMNAQDKLETERLAGLYDSTTPEIAPYTDAYYQRLNNVLAGVDTYWLAKGLRTSWSHKHSLFVDGGENDVRWGVEASYKGQSGVMQHSIRRNLGGSFYVDYRIKGLQIKNKVSFTDNKSTDVPFNSFSDYSHLLPYMRLYDDNSDYVRRLESFSGRTGMLVNPLYEINYYNSYDETTYQEISDDLSLNWYINDQLRIKGQFSALTRTTDHDVMRDPASASYSFATGNLNGDKTVSTSRRTMIDGSLMLLYHNIFDGGHNLNVCLSGNMRQTHATAGETHYRGFPGGNLTSSNYAAEVYGKPTSSDNTTRLLGVLLTTNYTWRDIYLADATGRLDGSSEFGADKRWSAFWSSGVGVNIHNYPWMKKQSTVSTLKVRGSYGLTGKTNFSLYSAKDMYRLQTDYWYPTGYGVYLYQMGNPQLKWERKYTFDYGLELGLWHDKIYAKLSAYDERTVDLITDYTLPSSTGFTSYKENMGKVKNVGMELELRWRAYSDKNWLIQLFGSFAHNKNTIVEISQAMRDYNKRVEELFKNYDQNKSTGTEFSRTYLKYYEGASLTSIYGMKSLGISPTNGKEIYLKRNGDVTDVWSADEWSVIGDTAPKGQGSFGCTVAWRDFSLFASWLYNFGGDAYNYTMVSYVENADIRNDNVDYRVLGNRWQKVGDVTTMKDIRDRNLTTGASSRFVQRDNTLRWTSLTLNYTFPHEKISRLKPITGLRLALTVNDLFYWSTIRQERGLDYPFTRSASLTANITF